LGASAGQPADRALRGSASLHSLRFTQRTLRAPPIPCAFPFRSLFPGIVTANSLHTIPCGYRSLPSKIPGFSGISQSPGNFRENLFPYSLCNNPPLSNAVAGKAGRGHSPVFRQAAKQAANCPQFAPKQGHLTRFRGLNLCFPAEGPAQSRLPCPGTRSSAGLFYTIFLDYIYSHIPVRRNITCPPPL
jgi:hypothetical protein